MGETKIQVSLRHRNEWASFRQDILKPAIEARDDAQAKFAKALADILKIYQEGERKAWGFGDGEAEGGLEIGWAEE